MALVKNTTLALQAEGKLAITRVQGSGFREFKETSDLLNVEL
jgi:hypothetical protein